MRIALALHGWPPERMGGTGLYVGALGEALRALGHTVSLLAPAAGERPELRAVPCTSGTHAHTLVAPPLRRWEQTWTQPQRAALLDGWFQTVKPEVLHVHHLSGLPWSLLAEARARGVRTVLTLHDYALPCARGQLIDAQGRACEGPAPARCAACLQDQLGLSPGLASLGRLLRRWPRARLLARRGVAAARVGARDLERVGARNMALQSLLGAVDVLLAPSEDLRQRAARLGMGGARPCELPLLRPVPCAGDPGDGPLRLLFASALIPTKGPDRLLDAFARLPAGQATLTLAGPAPAFDGAPDFADRLLARARRTPGVSVLGELPADSVGALLTAHDVLVLPSLWPENSPLVVREATAAGLRVIVSEEGGAAELAPGARRVPNRRDDGGALEQALQAEIRRGRGRVPPARWPTPAEHAAWLVSEVYGG